MTLPTADAVMMPTNVEIPETSRVSVSVKPVTCAPVKVVSNFFAVLK